MARSAPAPAGRDGATQNVTQSALRGSEGRRRDALSVRRGHDSLKRQLPDRGVHSSPGVDGVIFDSGELTPASPRLLMKLARTSERTPEPECRRFLSTCRDLASRCMILQLLRALCGMQTLPTAPYYLERGTSAILPSGAGAPFSDNIREVAGSLLVGSCRRFPACSSLDLEAAQLAWQHQVEASPVFSTQPARKIHGGPVPYGQFDSTKAVLPRDKPPTSWASTLITGAHFKEGRLNATVTSLLRQPELKISVASPPRAPPVAAA